MSKKIIFGLVSIIFFSGFNLARADVVINEVMFHDSLGSSYDDWVEVYNNDGRVDNFAKDLSSDGSCRSSSDYKFIENDTGHYICKYQGEGFLESGEYAIIAKDPEVFKKEWNFSGKIFKSSFDLTNTGKKISIQNILTSSLNDFDYTQYIDSANGDGKSLQLMNDESWKAALPTPGTENQILQVSNTDNTNTNAVATTGTTSSATTTIETKTNPKIAEIPSIKTKITSQSFTFAGLPMTFQASATGYSGEPRYFGKYFWNFGDGDSKEINAGQINKFSHTYFYPGEYAVTLEYFSNFSLQIPDATDKFVLKVVPIDISISSIGDEKDFFVELSNNSSYETDISNWYLDSGTKSFIFPKNTILPAKKKIVLSPRITSFSINDKNNLKFMTPEAEVAYDYSLPNIPVVKNIISSNTITSGNATKISGKNLTASAVSALSESSGAKNNSNNYLYFGALAGFLTLAGYAVYFIRKKNISMNSGDDFEILDE